jgi:hypothetical protein
MNWKTLLIGVALVIGMTLLLVEIRREFHEWNVDFSNSAWGAITAALISSVIGVLLKFATDAKLATLQGFVQRDLTTLKATLEDRNSATAARRDYEYEARKRLYDEVEPLLFQVYEAMDEAHHRVRSLTRTSRNGELGWLQQNGYYLSSTVYKLLLPVALLRLIQKRMTLVDLGLDPQIELRYLLLKQYARSFTDDFIFAQTTPQLPYDPNNADWRKKRKEDPAVYARQALVLGDLECVADLLIIKEGEKSRAISYGEFEGILKRFPVDDNLQEAIDLFRGFSPDQKPVLARMLVALGCLSKFIVATFHAGPARSSLKEQYHAIVDDALAKAVSWGQDRDDGIKIAADYWGRRLDLLSEEITARRADNKTPQRS